MKILLVLACSLFAAACGSDNEADELGVGAQCQSTDECNDSTEQECLLEFKGGYCGIEDCVDDSECPEFSACVAHDNATNYCFRTCTDKAECNENRDAEQESNCSGNVTFVEAQQDATKACVPPSG